MITRLWSNYVWRNPQLEMLAFEEPCHDGKPIEIARQVYHRLVVRLAGINAYWRQWQSIAIPGGAGYPFCSDVRPGSARARIGALKRSVWQSIANSTGSLSA